MAIRLGSEEIFPKMLIFSHCRQLYISFYLNFFNLKLFNLFLAKVLNILNKVSSNQKKNMVILYKKKFQSSPTSTQKQAI